MSIELITGQPGAGKSLFLVDRACALNEPPKLSFFKRLLCSLGLIPFPDSPVTRPIYNCGIDGLREDIAKPIDDLSKWQDLPDGSIVLVDEAWNWFPTRGPSRRAPEWIEALAVHRHRGFDFLMATQHPTQLDSFVRHLCGRHIHLSRKFGTHNVQVSEWAGVRSDLSSSSAQKLALTRAWRFPKKRFDLYKSATVHTVKRRIPFKLWFAGICALAVPFFIWKGTSVFRSGSPDSSSSSPASASSSSRPYRPSSVMHSDKVLTPAQWARRQLPRVASAPWSAPIFDGMPVTTHPDLLCVIAETSNRQGTVCSCYTEQVTPLPDVSDRVCRQAAKHGVYNPYRQTDAAKADQRDALAERRSASSGFPSGRVLQHRSLRPAASVGRLNHAVGLPATSYVPPEYGQWNSDPFGPIKGK